MYVGRLSWTSTTLATLPQVTYHVNFIIVSTSKSSYILENKKIMDGSEIYKINFLIQMLSSYTSLRINPCRLKQFSNLPILIPPSGNYHCSFCTADVLFSTWNLGRKSNSTFFDVSIKCSRDFVKKRRILFPIKFQSKKNTSWNSYLKFPYSSTYLNQFWYT